MSVTLNDWTGTVSYTGASTAPTFSLTRGADTVTGTATAPTALRLGARLAARFFKL